MRREEAAPDEGGGVGVYLVVALFPLMALAAAVYLWITPGY